MRLNRGEWEDRAVARFSPVPNEALCCGNPHGQESGSTGKDFDLPDAPGSASGPGIWLTVASLRLGRLGRNFLIHSNA